MTTIAIVGVVVAILVGLFLGPIVLAVIWELILAWVKERESANAGQVS